MNSATPLKIGIAGCGAIGSSLARTIVSDFRGKAVLAGLYDIVPAKATALGKKLRCSNAVVHNLDSLVDRSSLIIEASQASASAGIAIRAVRKGRSVMVMSVGGLLGSVVPTLQRWCRRSGARVYIPSGAISGIDAVKAAAVAGIRRVTLITTKHPRSFAGVAYVRARGINLDRIKKPTVIFSGSAARAVTNFPQNINVAAVLSIAGIGAQRTRVKIIASPLATKNIHEIIIESPSAMITTRTENVVHPQNPKTSYLAVLSAAALLKQIIEPVRIGT